MKTEIVYYNYGEPPHELRNTTMLLLTKGGTGILGRWNNCVDLIGWYPMPERNLQKEKRRGL